MKNYFQSVHKFLCSEPIQRFRMSKVGEFAYKLSIVLGIKRVEVTLFMCYDAKHPTDAMRKTKEYYTQMQPRIDSICTHLGDDMSRDVYRKMLQVRATHDLRQMPPYSTNDQYFPEDIVQIKNGEVFIDCGAYTGD